MVHREVTLPIIQLVDGAKVNSFIIHNKRISYWSVRQTDRQTGCSKNVVQEMRKTHFREEFMHVEIKEHIYEIFKFSYLHILTHYL